MRSYMKKGYIIFTILCMVMMVFPFAGLLISGIDTESESGEESVLPELKSESGGVNLDILSDWGDYFTENFAFRKGYVSVNAKLYGSIFNASVTDQVLLGTDGWMFYTNTLNDYTSTHTATDRGINNSIHNLELISDYTESCGSIFLLTIAPNKNSLYDENMPYYYNKGEGENTYDKLEKKLEGSDINYVNLYAAFENEDDVLYLKQDSHWNNKGAALAFQTIMDAAGLEHENYDDMSYEVRADHTGDLAEMIYPHNYELEENIYYDKDWSYSYVGEVTDNMDDWIETTSSKNDNVLLMYRDSFGESLLPFFADEFGTAYFSRLVPYNLNNITSYNPDYVIIERVERRLTSFAESAAIMPVPEVKFTSGVAGYTDSAAWSELLNTDETGEAINIDIGSVGLKTSGDYYRIDGIVNAGYMTDDSEIYVGFETSDGTVTYYDTFWISQTVGDAVDDNGFSAYFLKSDIPENVTSLQVVVVQ
jgi:hypothetical protein